MLISCICILLCLLATSLSTVGLGEIRGSVLAAPAPGLVYHQKLTRQGCATENRAILLIYTRHAQGPHWAMWRGRDRV